MNKAIIIILLLAATPAFAQVMKSSYSLSNNPWLTGYTTKFEAEFENSRDDDGKINGYSNELEIQLRKKISKNLSLVVGGELDGSQEDDEPATYSWQEAALGVRYKMKLGSWKFKNIVSAHYYPDEKYRHKKGNDGAIRVRVRTKKKLTKRTEIRLRTRYYNYFLNSGKNKARMRKFRIEARPFYKLGNLRLGLFNKFVHEKKVAKDENYLEFGPILRWDPVDRVQIVAMAEFQPWNSKEGGFISGYNHVPTFSFEVEFRI